MSLIFSHSKSGGKIFQAGWYEIPAYLKPNNPDKIDAIVFSAEESIPMAKAAKLPSQLEKYYVPLNDSVDLSKVEIIDTIFEAERAADFVVSRILAGKIVLVTCWQGRNRSGLINALAIKKLTNAKPEEIIRWIKANRLNALTNSLFERIIQIV